MLRESHSEPSPKVHRQTACDTPKPRNVHPRVCLGPTASLRSRVRRARSITTSRGKARSFSLGLSASKVREFSSPSPSALPSLLKTCSERGRHRLARCVGARAEMTCRDDGRYVIDDVPTDRADRFFSSWYIHSSLLFSSIN